MIIMDRKRKSEASQNKGCLQHPHNHFALDRLKKTFSFFLISFFPIYALSGELTLRPETSMEYVNQDIESFEAERSFSTDNLILQNVLNANYIAKKLKTSLNLRHNHVQRSLEDESESENYLDYTVLTNLTAIENALTIDAKLSQTYRSPNVDNLFTDDFLLNPQNLIKTTTKQGGINFYIENASTFELDSRLNISETSTDENGIPSIVTSSIFDNESVGGSIRFETKPQKSYINAYLEATVQDITRANREDFDRSTADFYIGAPVADQWEIFTSAFFEENNIQGAEQTEQEPFIEFYSYGLGLSWQPSVGRTLRVAANRSNRDDIESTNDTFVSFSVDWRFTSLTSLNASYSKRAFGDSANLVFNHRNKRWRNRINYTETVTSNSRLVASSNDGVFACDSSFSSIDECTLVENDPTSLPDGQILVPFTETGFDLNDNIIIRKRGAIFSGYTKRRTSAGLSVSRSRDEDVEDLRFTTTDLVSLNASIRFGSRSTLKATLSYSEIDREQAAELLSSRIQRAELSVERRFRSKLFASLGYSYLKRRGDDVNSGATVGGLRGPLTDNRINLSIRYQFNSR